LRTQYFADEPVAHAARRGLQSAVLIDETALQVRFGTGDVRRDCVNWHHGGATRQRGDHDGDRGLVAISPGSIGLLLRTARERKGLDLLTVHDQIGRPITVLEALEAGDLASLPNQAVALSTLRRYAALLGLDGDRLVLQLVEAWSSQPTGTHQLAGRELDHPSMAPLVTALTSSPEHLLAFTETGRVPAVGPGAATGAGFATGTFHGLTGPPTGMLTVVPKEEIRETNRARRRARRRRRAPVTLRLVTWLVLLAVLVGAAGLALDRWRPRLLVDWHVLTLATPGTASTGSGPGSAGGGAGSTPTKASGRNSVVVETSSGTNGARYHVKASRFTVILATSAPCWVQVSTPASAAPSSQGVQQRGQVVHYAAKQGSLAVEVGSSAVLLGVEVGGRNVFLAHPTSAPFTYTFDGT
jgi:hypothetical protein